MQKFLSFFLLFLVISFFLVTFKYYSSKKNIEETNLNRSEFEKKLKSKDLNVPILDNNTNNVIIFNDSFSEGIEKEKKRSFWDLIKSK